MITLFTVSGTAALWWQTYPSDVARELTSEWDAAWAEIMGTDGPDFRWQGVDYPAATFPMRPSVNVAVANLVQQLLAEWSPTAAPEDDAVLVGYSQGAIAVCMVWRDYILNPEGELHHLLGRVRAVITYGNPMRAPNIAHGNVYAGQPVPGKQNGITTGGIAGSDALKPAECLHPVTGKKIVIDFAHTGDIYTAAPVGATPWTTETVTGHDMTLIYNAIMEFDGTDLLALATTLVPVLSMNLPQVMGLIQALMNGALFFGAGMSSPHYTYDVAPAVKYLRAMARCVADASPKPTADWRFKPHARSTKETP